MIAMNKLKHYCDEEKDSSRNPFSNKTRIDCDKLFVCNDIICNDKLKTKIRPNVCDDLFNKVIKELNEDGYKTIAVHKNNLISLNPLITSA